MRMLAGYILLIPFVLLFYSFSEAASPSDQDILKQDTITIRDTIIYRDTISIPGTLENFKQLSAKHFIIAEDTIIIKNTFSLKNAISLKSVLETPDTLTVVGVGDIMMGTNFPSKKYLHPQGCSFFFSEVGSVLTNADVTVGNLEGSLSDSAELEKRCKDTTNCFAFRMPLDYAGCMKNNGFDFLSIANNHSYDFGIEGVEHTSAALDSMNISYAGTPKFPYSILNKDGVTYGFCAFSPNNGTIGITDYDRAAEIVKSLNDTCDVVIVSFHGGAEGKEHRNVTQETEYFYGENRGNVHKFAHHVIDAGADLVFGHGPHVTRAVELYKNRLICYSLGNFITYGRFNLRGPNGIAPIIKTYLTENGKFIGGEIIPVKQYYSGKVVIDPMKRAVYEIKNLTAKDFPDSELTITEDGLIHKKELTLHAVQRKEN